MSWLAPIVSLAMLTSPPITSGSERPLSLLQDFYNLPKSRRIVETATMTRAVRTIYFTSKSTCNQSTPPTS